MIPVALPSVEQLLYLALFFAATLFWLGWTIRLVVRYATGRWRRPVLLPYTLITACALFTLWQFADFYLQMRSYERERAASYFPELAEPMRLGQIDMPKGTKLELAVADQRESFKRAVFPSPVRMVDIDAVEVARYIAIQTNEKYETVGFTPENMRITGDGTTMQNGWRCDALQPVEFELKPDGGVSAFSNCKLADGNVVDGITLPGGTLLRASTGNVYVDGFVDSDRWVLDMPEHVPVRIDHFELADATIALDAERKLYEVRSAVLANVATLAERRYAAASAIRFNPRYVREDYPGAWLITPPPGVDGSQPLAPETIVQRRDGKVLATLTD
ncbi:MULTISPECIES: hypothetical protein [Pseudomonas]|uniref:Uncharacterized protein n=1 Tax=Pseudomonas azadiae TaxID=2843612 RepID=A0ABS6NUT4_9PSED|nr:MULTISPECIES: hypothetical protein [Pseudomonas]MBV4451571.1 hypothetical protein [Pseudomonas azadiae]NMF43300.1 hypothetical protein [Pseudomonas sp. SWRI 103]